MKVILVVGGSRAGLEFFLSLLDGHTEVLQFPGIIYGDKKLTKILSHNNSAKISANFIKSYQHFFDSRLNTRDRHNMLGDDKSQYYIVDKEKFTKNFDEIYKNKLKNKLYDKLLMLHQAYAKTCDQDISKKKIIIINCHIIKYANFFSKKIMGNMDYEIIHTIRNPLSALSSPIKNWLNYNSGKDFFAKSIYFHLDLIVNGIKNLQKLNRKMFLLKLETLHRNNSIVMADFCKTYDLRHEACLENSTYFDMKWWGDKISGKDLNGINKDFNVSFDSKKFYKRDIQFLEFILKDYLVFYKYKFTADASNFFLNIFPMKCEILTWKNTFKHKNFKNILSIPFFYIKRLLFINKLSQKKLEMPRVFGME